MHAAGHGRSRLLMSQLRQLAFTAGVPREAARKLLLTGRSSSFELMACKESAYPDFATIEPLIARCGGDIKAWKDYYTAVGQEEVLLSPAPPLFSQVARSRPRELTGARLYKLLDKTYPEHPSATLWGAKYPTTVFPHVTSELNSILGGLTVGPLPAPLALPSDVDPIALGRMAELIAQQHELHLHSGPTYALDQLSVSEAGVRVDCRPGRYFAMKATSDLLEDEIIRALRETNPDPDLPMRTRIQDLVEDPILEGAGRDSAVSHATAVFVRRASGGFDVVMPSRSDKVAAHQHLRHVAPSGIFAPFNDLPPTWTQDFDLVRNFEREFSEELYSVKELDVDEDIQGSTPRDDRPEIVRLQTMLERGDATLCVTGVAVNLLSLRLEICLALVVDDPEWIGRERGLTDVPWRPNWEMAQRASAVRPIDAGHQTRVLLQLDDGLKPLKGETPNPGHLVPNAAGALALACEYLRSR